MTNIPIEMHLIDNDPIKTSIIIDIPIGMDLVLIMVDLVKMHLAHNVPIGT
jgi:hypothetical protein